MITSSSIATIRPAAITGQPAQPASDGLRSDHVPITMSVNSRPSTLSHQGPCCAAAMSEATPNDSSRTSGQTICSGSPRPEPKTIKVLCSRISPEKITIRPAMTKTM